MPESLLTPILSDDLRSINYFNGRILTAEDLRVEQRGGRRREELLGSAIGEGVVRGLEVKAVGGGDPAVTVAPGLALNRKGQTLLLERPVTVRIVPENDSIEPGEAVFVPCPEVPSGETAVPAGTGAYVLVASPAADVKALAPRIGLADDGVARTCESRFIVEGLQFRLVHLDANDPALVADSLGGPIRDLMTLAAPVESQESRLRSRLAHWCLGTGATSRSAATLYEQLGSQASVAHGPLDALRVRSASEAGKTSGLTDCDVPLALLYWTRGGLRFVDMWAVRRRLHRQPLTHASPGTTGRGLAEAEAAFYQFQQHLADLLGPAVSTTALGRVDAVNYFPYIPAAGVLPVLQAPGGGDDLGFFTGLTRRTPTFIDGHRLPMLLQFALAYPPIAVAEHELIWLYTVRQNLQDEGADAPTRYLVFASGQIPFLGDPLYDVARWDFAHYGPGIVTDFTPAIDANIITGG